MIDPGLWEVEEIISFARVCSGCSEVRGVRSERVRVWAKVNEEDSGGEREEGRRRSEVLQTSELRSRKRRYAFEAVLLDRRARSSSGDPIKSSRRFRSKRA